MNETQAEYNRRKYREQTPEQRAFYAANRAKKKAKLKRQLAYKAKKRSEDNHRRYLLRTGQVNASRKVAATKGQTRVKAAQTVSTSDEVLSDLLESIASVLKRHYLEF